MRANQFTESQKAKMVEQYRAGDSSIAVAKRFGCSDRTVMRCVWDRLGPVEFEALKQKNRKRPTQPHTTPAPATTPRNHPSAPGHPEIKPAGSGPGQFTDSQRAEMVEQYRAGDSSVVVAKRFGCSDRTVMRCVRDRLGPVEFEALKQKNRKRPTQPHTTPAPATTPRNHPSAPGHPEIKPAGSGPGQFTDSQRAEMVEQYRAGDSSVVVAKRFGCSDRTVMRLVRARLDSAELVALKEHNRKRSSQIHAKPAAGDLPTEAEQRREAAQTTKLDLNRLPSPLYLLVDRSVELQPQTLASLQHLGPLPTDEKQRQGLVLFSNVRQARRQCRRNQRVVKLADPKLLGKTAPHLLAQGISRLVVEGTLYALPGSTAPAQS